MKKGSALTFILITLLMLFLPAYIVRAQEDTPVDWQKDWAVKKGFTLSIDTEGYSFPSEIVFVPNPGKDPKDVLYFVAELRGKIMAVTNDRSIVPFADGFANFEPKAELPEGAGQTGLAGLCLDPEHGYVFATYAYQDDNNILRNNVIRFRTKPRLFSTHPEDQITFDRVFGAGASALSHQIGACQVYQGELYISVADGGRPDLSQDLHYLNGKILRMTLDGDPLPDNPFYDPAEGNQPVNYIWAYGLRNPFGLKMIQGKLFSAENGLQIDRFISVEKGKNYLWNGKDNSMMTNAEVVFATGVSPVHLDYLPRDASIFPDAYQPAFFLALAGAGGSNKGKDPGVLSFRYDLNEGRVTSTPEFLVKYAGPGFQMVTGIGVGPDGIYFVPIYQPDNGRIFKIMVDPDQSYPYPIKQNLNGIQLMRAYGCFSCHPFGNDPGFQSGGGIVGPNLEPVSLVDRLRKRLASPEYLNQLQEANQLDIEPYRNYRQARQELAGLTGDEKIHKWLVYHILEPQFDNPRALMPNLQVSSEDAQMITDFLMQRAQERTFMARAISRIRDSRDLILAFAAGFLFAAILAASTYLPRRKIASRRSPDRRDPTDKCPPAARSGPLTLRISRRRVRRPGGSGQ